jgi:flagellar biosynthesis protein FlhG
VDLYPRSPASRALQALCDAFLAQPPPDVLPGGVKLFWQQLLRERGEAEA